MHDLETRLSAEQNISKTGLNSKMQNSGRYLKTRAAQKLGCYQSGPEFGTLFANQIGPEFGA